MSLVFNTNQSSLNQIQQYTTIPLFCFIIKGQMNEVYKMENDRWNKTT